MKKENNDIINTIIPLLQDGRAGKVVIPKSDRLLTPLLSILNTNQVQLDDITRQRKKYLDKEILLTRPKDALTFMSAQHALWAISTLDGMIEWAGENGYRSTRSFLDQYEVILLGLGFCSVELTCRNDRPDLIARIEQAQTRSSLAQIIKDEGLTIPTDVPYITRKQLPEIPLINLGGGVEIACSEDYPIGVGVIEKGTTTKEEGLYRFASPSPAILVQKSQLCLVTRK